jgi:hypothetical protein
MPKINEYGAPETESQVPLEVSSQRIELAGQQGQALRRIGGEIQDLGEISYRQAAQEEVSKAQVQWSQARVDAKNKLDQQIREGDVNVDQLKTDFQNYVDKNSDQYTTAHGRQAFNEQAAHTQAMLIGDAVNAQAILKANQAADNRRMTLANDSSSVYSHPENFVNLYNAHMAGIDQDVSTGALPAKLSGKAKFEAGQELATNAVRGWAKDDPEKAQKLLDSGYFDKFFDGDKKSSLQGYINGQRGAKETEAVRQIRLQEKAEKARTEKWKRDHFDGIVEGTTSVDEIKEGVRSGQLTPEAGKEQLATLKQALKGEGSTDWGLYNTLARRIGEEQYVDPQEIRKHFGQGLTKANVKDLIEMNDNSDEGKILKEGRKSIYDLIDTAARFKDPITLQGYSTVGERKRGQAKTDLINAERAIRKAGGNVNDLYDSKSPLYFGSDENLKKYQTPLAERFSQSVQQMKMDATTNPDGTPKSEQVKKPGVSFGDFVKGNLQKKESK